jgi:hypothetical protein
MLSVPVSIELEDINPPTRGRENLIEAPSIDAPSRGTYSFPVNGERHERDPLRALPPEVAAEIRAAAAEVDGSLFEIMRALTVSERIAWASGTAETLARLRGEDGPR